MEPRITKHAKRLDLRYDLPHRVRCSAVYPVTAPNGSVVILYGYENGLRALWRGGRRVRRPTSEITNKASDADIIILDDSDDGAMNKAEAEPTPHYEDEEEALDEEQPYANLIHDITIPTSSAVSRIAVPCTSLQWPPAKTTDESEAVISIATVEGELLVLKLPLAPIATSNAVDKARDIAAGATVIQRQGSFIRDLTMRFFGQAQDGVFLAAVSDKLRLWRFELDGLADDVQHLAVTLNHSATTVAHHPASRQPQLLVADTSGTVHIYVPPRDWATTIDINNPHAQGAWSATLHAPFAVPSHTAPSLPTRKLMLGAQWVLNGRCIFALFDDGAWGIWDTLVSSSADQALEDFIVSGYLDSSSVTEVSDATSAKRSGASLAPMTPNTRKARSTALFSAPHPKGSSTTTRGGITVSRTTSTAGSVDESVLIWFGSDVYTIPSMQTFWQRSTSGSRGLGSLYAPGIAHVSALELFHERVSSISQLPAAQASSGAAKMTKTPDFVLSAESRLIIAQQNIGPAATSFTDRLVMSAGVQDQRMLDAGELDIGGMDRLLSTMATTDSRQRKVGFAH